jgi:hypothetical protein
MAGIPANEMSRCVAHGLEALRRGNPAARSLPLLVMMGEGSAGQVCLELNHGALEVGVVPC